MTVSPQSPLPVPADHSPPVPSGVVLPPAPASLWQRVRERIRAHRANLQTLLVLLAVNFLTAAVGVVTQVQIANTLGREQFGELAYALAIASFGQILIRFGTDRTLVRDLVHRPDQFAHLVAASLHLRYALTLLLVVMLVGWKFMFPAPDVTWGLLLVILANSVLSLDLQPAYEALGRMPRHAWYFFLYKTIYFLAIWGIILSAPRHLSVATIGLVAAASVVIYMFIQHRWLMRQFPRSSATAGTAAALARRNLWVFLATVLGFLISGWNQLVLKHSTGAAALGGYAAAMQLVLVGMLLLEQISRIGRPEAARCTRPGTPWAVRIRFLTQYLGVMVATVAPLAAAMLLAPEVILRLLFRPEYAAAAPTLRILGGYLVLYSIGLAASQYVISEGLDRSYIVSVGAGGLLSIVLCALLIPPWGAEGAAWTLVGAHGLPILCYWVIIASRRRVHSDPSPEVLQS